MNINTTPRTLDAAGIYTLAGRLPYGEFAEAARHTLARIGAAAGFAGALVEVNTSGGETAAISALKDNRNRIHFQLHLPTVPLDAQIGAAQARRLLGFVVHEAAHVAYTDLDARTGAKPVGMALVLAAVPDATPESVAALLNVTEDYAIERRACHPDLPLLGAAPQLLGALNDEVIAPYAVASVAQAADPMRQAVALIMAHLNRHGRQVAPGLDAALPAARAAARPEVLAAVDVALAALDAAETATAGTMRFGRQRRFEITKRLAEALHAIQQQGQQQGQQQQGQQQGQQQQGQQQQQDGQQQGQQQDGQQGQQQGQQQQGQQQDGQQGQQQDGQQGQQQDGQQGQQGQQQDGQQGQQGQQQDGQQGQQQQDDQQMAPAGTLDERRQAATTAGLPVPTDYTTRRVMAEQRPGVPDRAPADDLRNAQPRHNLWDNHQYAMYRFGTPSKRLADAIAIAQGADARALADATRRGLRAAEQIKRERRLTAGRLDRRALVRASLGAQDVFGRKTHIPGQSTAAMVMLDMSGSMGERIAVHLRNGQTLTDVMRITATLGALGAILPALTRAGAETAVWGFASASKVTAGKTLVTLKDWGGGRVTSAAAWLTEGQRGAYLGNNGTPMEREARAAGQALRARRVSRRVCLWLCDGEPNDETPLQLELTRQRAAGIEHVAIGLQAPEVVRLFGVEHARTVDNLADLPAAVLAVLMPGAQ